MLEKAREDNRQNYHGLQSETATELSHSQAECEGGGGSRGVDDCHTEKQQEPAWICLGTRAGQGISHPDPRDPRASYP